MSATNPQDAADQMAQSIQMAQMAPPAPVDPHAALTAPIGPAPPEPPPMMAGGEKAAAPKKAEAAPAKMSPLANQQEHINKNLMADYQKDADPYGSPDNHPGFFGKLLHGLSHATGGDTRRQWEEQGLEGRLQNIAKEESTEGLQGAQAGEQGALEKQHEAETPEVAPNAESHRTLEQSEVTEHNAQAAALLHPQAKTAFEAWQQQNPGKPIEEWLKEQAANKNVRPDTPEQQYIDEYQQAHPGGTIAQAERAYTLDTQRPNQISPVLMFAPQPGGGTKAIPVGPGSTVPQGAQTAAGVNAVSTPTAATRTMGEMAATVQPQMDNVINEVQQLAGSLGPSVGRWNQLMVNKGGTDFPEFAGLDTDLDLLSSAIVRTHFGARGGQGYREELRKQFGEAQSPEDLINRIQHAEGWIKGYAAAAGKGNKDGGGVQPKEGETKVNSAGDHIKFSGGKWGPA